MICAAGIEAMALLPELWQSNLMRKVEEKVNNITLAIV